MTQKGKTCLGSQQRTSVLCEYKGNFTTQHPKQMQYVNANHLREAIRQMICQHPRGNKQHGHKHLLTMKMHVRKTKKKLALNSKNAMTLRLKSQRPVLNLFVKS